jgi:hypothetical protein
MPVDKIYSILPKTVSYNKIKLLCWYLHIPDEGEEGSGLPGSTQLALPGPAQTCPTLPGHARPSPALPGPAQTCPALPCPALQLVGWGGGGQWGARGEGGGGV